jgi:DNA polymerase-3 subunit delta
MKIASGKAESFCKKPDPSFKIFLVFGSDKGMVREYMRFLVNSQGINPSDSFAVTSLSAGEIRSEPSRLSDEAMGFSLLAENRIVIVEDVTDSDKLTVQQIVDDNGSLTTPVIFLGGNLSATSQIRKLCEKAGSVATIAAYADDERSLPGFVKGFFTEQQKRASPDAVFFLCQQLGTDRGITRQELDKVVTYVGEDAEITLKDVQAVTANEAGFFLDDLLYAVFDGKLNEVERLFSLAIENAAQPSIVLQMTARHASRLHAVKTMVEQGTAIERSILLTGGRLFWKFGDRFKQQVRSWHGQNLLGITHKLVSATTSSRKNLGIDDALCHRTLMAVAASSPLRKK